MKKFISIFIALLVSSSVSAQNLSNAVEETVVAIQGTAVATAYPATPQSTSVKPIKALEILNLANCDIVVSTDNAGTASTDKTVVPAGTAWTMPYAANWMYSNKPLGVRGTSCTTGNVYIQRTE